MNGIGRPTAEALYEIGIRSYADLIQFLNQHTVKEIAEELGKHGAKLPPGFKKEKWISYAGEASQREELLPVPTREEPGAATGTEEQLSSNRFVEHDDEFLVFFDMIEDADGKPSLRTTVYHEKNAGTEAVFDGSETAPWGNWMIEHANLPSLVKPVSSQEKSEGDLAAPKAEGAVPATLAKPLDVLLDISDVQVSVVEPWEKIPTKRLKAEVHFQLSGADAGTLTAEEIPFRTEIYKIDLGNGLPEQVTFRAGQLVPGTHEYIEELEFAIPEVGRYEYHSVIRLLPLGDLMAYYRGPVMKINP
jgi:hypothetical protein